MLAHLHDNALAMARITREALANRQIEFYDGGRSHRDRMIDLGARLPPESHRSRLLAATSDLDDLWARLDPNDWARKVALHEGDLRDAVAARHREVEIHMVDLGAGTTTADWSTRFARDLIQHVLPSAPGRLSRPMPLELVPSDEPEHRYRTGSPEESRIVIHGETNDLAAWLVGRTPVGMITAQGDAVPELGPWK